jgi:nitrile hydratase accessory protein
VTFPDSVDGERTFDELWEAQAFAMAVALCERGLFTWPEWTATMAEVRAGDHPSGHYGKWLTALERVVEDNHIADRPALLRYREAWRHAAARTPHGMPIELQEGDFRG